MDKWVWLPHPTDIFLLTRIKSTGQDKVVLVSTSGEEFERPLSLLSRLKIAEASTASNEYADLTRLSEFNVGAILHQLQKRYHQDRIYTSIGDILISINPFKLMGLYTPEIIRQYRQRKSGVSLPPHIFGVAENAYRGIMGDRKPQSIIVSGESGAGKTEAAKLVLQYLSEVAGSESGVEQGMYGCMGFKKEIFYYSLVGPFFLSSYQRFIFVFLSFSRHLF